MPACETDTSVINDDRKTFLFLVFFLAICGALRACRRLLAVMIILNSAYAFFGKNLIEGFHSRVTPWFGMTHPCASAAALSASIWRLSIGLGAACAPLP